MIVYLPLDSSIFNETDFMKQKETTQETIMEITDKEALPVDIKDMGSEFMPANKKKILITRKIMMT